MIHLFLNLFLIFINNLGEEFIFMLLMKFLNIIEIFFVYHYHQKQ